MPDKTSVLQTGKLFVVATPIGHLSDISQRQQETLQSVDLILAEDTRHSGKMLKQLMVNTPVISCYEQNEASRIESVLTRLREGQDVALISDAGTPLISDPGYLMVSACHAAGIQVVPIPGPCALIAALSSSGLQSHRFSFFGFLPVKKSEREKLLSELSNQSQTAIFYETPHRIVETLKDCAELFNDSRRLCIAREISKLHEDIRQGSAKELLDWLQAHPEKQKGEFVLLVEASAKQESTNDSQALRDMIAVLLKELSTSKAAQIAAQISGEKKNKCYQLALELEKEQL